MGKKGVFITGTDTGVGKTIIAAAITRTLKVKGISVGVMKPVETGCRKEGNILVPRDGIFLQNMAEIDTLISEITPYQYETPVAPCVASDIEGNIVTEGRIVSIFKRLSQKYDFMVVEGVGGLMAPIRDNFLVKDLIKTLGLPLLLVAKNTLGVINHTLLTLRVAHNEKITVLGVIINSVNPSSGSIAEDTNPAILHKLINVPILGVFPFLKNLNKKDLERAFTKSVDFEPLLNNKSVN